MATATLWYWPTIPGRGEFVRLGLEAAGVSYDDAARSAEGPDFEAVARRLAPGDAATPAFAPPLLEIDGLRLAQTANILLYLGAHYGLAPADEGGRLWTHQLQLTLADWLTEVHDTHHPMGPSLYYEEQRDEAARRAGIFRAQRLPKYLDYFEAVLRQGEHDPPRLVPGLLSCADLSLFQMLAGLRYAFPRAMAALEPDYPGCTALHDAVAAAPPIEAYLRSERRVAFNDDGIFRHYPELDDPS